jgi:hypothetical protein
MTELPEVIFIKHDSINQVLWDENILNSINGNIYANFWYLDVVTNNKWDALVSKDYKWLMPLPSKNKYGFNYLPTPSFIQQLGIFGPGPFSIEICNQFLKHLNSNYDLIEYQLNHYNSSIKSTEFNIKERINLLLKLDKEEIFNQYSDGIKRKIKKAISENVKLSSASIRSIINLFQSNNEIQLKNWDYKNYNLLEQLFHMSAFRKMGFCYGAYNEKGELISGMVIFEYKNTATFIFSANSEEGKLKGALTYIIHQYLTTAPSNIEIFDFEGSDNEGLYQFYKGFGAQESNYLHLKKNNLPFWARIFKK